MAKVKLFIYNTHRIGELSVWGITTHQNAFRNREMKSNSDLGLEGVE